MRKLFFILFTLILSLFCFGQKAIITLDTNAILIGEQISFKIECVDIEKAINWPLFNDTIVDGIEIISRSEIDTISNSNTDKNTYSFSQEYLITSWDSGAYYIAPIKLNSNLSTEGLLLNVMSVSTDQNSEIKDIKEPLDAEYEFKDFMIWIILLLTIILIVYLLKKYVFNTKDKVEKKIIKKIIPAHITALKELNHIEQKELWQSGKIKQYHSGISEILRKYMEHRFQFIALELTTDEILSHIKNNISREEYVELQQVLQRADLAKFAKSKPNEEENKQSMELAKRFVDKTKKSEKINE
jgi:hypothetical protein